MIEQDLNLIRKIVWSYTKTIPGLEFDDLFSEACIIYLLAEKRYDPSRGKKSTFMWHSIKNKLNILIGKETKKKTEMLYEHPESDYYDDPETQLLANEKWQLLMSALSPEAREICQLIIEEPDIYLPLHRPKLCRGIIRKTLLSRGWSYSKIWDSFTELKEALSL